MKSTRTRQILCLALTLALANATMLGIGSGPDAGDEFPSGELVEMAYADAIVGGQGWKATLGCMLCTGAAIAAAPIGLGFVAGVVCGAVCWHVITEHF